jgi:hypothetical protein
MMVLLYMVDYTAKKQDQINLLLAPDKERFDWFLTQFRSASGLSGLLDRKMEEDGGGFLVLLIVDDEEVKGQRSKWTERETEDKEFRRESCEE